MAGRLSGLTVGFSLDGLAERFEGLGNKDRVASGGGHSAVEGMERAKVLVCALVADGGGRSARRR